MSEPYAPAMADDGPARRYRERVDRKIEIDMKLEALAHAMHFATQALAHGFARVDQTGHASSKVKEMLARDPALAIVTWAEEFERFLARQAKEAHGA